MSKRLSLLCLTGGVLALATAAGAADDWEYWNQVTFAHQLTDKVGLCLAFQEKWQDNFSDLFLYSATFVPTVSLAKGVSFGAGYRFERKEAEDHWANEHRLLLPLSFTWTFEPWTICWRNQPEYRNLEDKDRWRLRERILVERPVRVGQLTVTPFAFEEIFYDFTGHEMNQSRLAVGLSLPVRQRVSLDLYYMNRADKRGDWSTTNVLGTELAIEF